MSASSMLLLTGALLVIHVIYSTVKVALAKRDFTVEQNALLSMNLVGGFWMFGAGAIMKATTAF